MPFSSFSTDVSASATLSMDDWKRKSLFQRPQAAGSWSALWNPKTNTHTYIYNTHTHAHRHTHRHAHRRTHMYTYTESITYSLYL